MTTLREAAQAALAYMDSVGSTDMWPEEWQVAENLRAALAEFDASLTDPTKISVHQTATGCAVEAEVRRRCGVIAERDALIAEVRDREDVLERAGFRRCDISACNCGSWHQVGGFKARFDEIKEAIAEHVDLNGKTLLTAVQEALAERNALARKLDAVREVYAGMEGFVPQTAPEGYCLRIIEQMAHAAMKGASDE